MHLKFSFIRVCAGSLLLHGRVSSCGGRGDDSLFAVHRLFIAVASLVAPIGSGVGRLQQLRLSGSGAQAQ